MPLYEYQCESCGARFERIQKFSDPPVAECPTCGGPVRKLLSSPAIQFKGSGFYITDYAKPGSGEKAGGSGKSAASSEKGGGETTTSTDTGAKSESAKPASETPAKPVGTTSE